MTIRRSRKCQSFLRAPARRQARRILRIEALEDRRMLSATPLTSSISIADDLIVQAAPSYGRLGEALRRLAESYDGFLYGMSEQGLATFIPYRAS